MARVDDAINYKVGVITRERTPNVFGTRYPAIERSCEKVINCRSFMPWSLHSWRLRSTQPTTYSRVLSSHPSFSIQKHLPVLLIMDQGKAFNLWGQDSRLDTREYIGRWTDPINNP